MAKPARPRSARGAAALDIEESGAPVGHRRMAVVVRWNAGLASGEGMLRSPTIRTGDCRRHAVARCALPGLPHESSRSISQLLIVTRCAKPGRGDQRCASLHTSISGLLSG